MLAQVFPLLHPPCRLHLVRVQLAALLVGAGLGAPIAASDLRFSVALEPAERAACGLPRLSSDQVAVLDALVRRDTAARGAAPPSDSTPPNSAPATTTFSQRLTAGERATAGLAALTTAELARLDTAVERHQDARLARALLAPPVFLARRSSILPTERKKDREIHGSFSLSYGVGSGGYSEKSGSMVLTLEDPAKGFSLSVGYSETHTKGGVPYYLYRDPLLERPRLLPGDPLRP
jgi:hypothetical protein